jgi:uncharacterized protein (DUF4415 family)
MPNRKASEDPENPFWTKEDFKRAKRRDELPPEIEALLPKRRKATTTVELELSADVLKALKDSGDDWQARADDALREKFVLKSPTGKAA